MFLGMQGFDFAQIYSLSPNFALILAKSSTALRPYKLIITERFFLRYCK